QLITASGGAATDNLIGFRVSGDSFNRLRANASGQLRWGSGSATQDCTIFRSAANLFGADEFAFNVGGAAEVWNALTPGNSWANSPLGPNLQYRRIIVTQTIEIIGDLSSGTVTDGTTIATLPVGYRPARQQWITPTFVSGAPTTLANARISVGTGGALN